MFISEFGFDPLMFCKPEHNGRTTNTFRLILDMYFKDELGQKTVKIFGIFHVRFGKTIQCLRKSYG